MMSILIEQLINITDAIFLGHVGEIELGASALAGIWYLAIYMLGFGFSIGLQVVIARRNGEQQYSETGRTFFQELLFLSGLASSTVRYFENIISLDSEQSDCIRKSIFCCYSLPGLAHLGINVFFPISCVTIFPSRYNTYKALEQSCLYSCIGEYTL